MIAFDLSMGSLMWPTKMRIAWSLDIGSHLKVMPPHKEYQQGHTSFGGIALGAGWSEITMTLPPCTPGGNVILRSGLIPTIHTWVLLVCLVT